jgi:hypothetical protein
VGRGVERVGVEERELCVVRNDVELWARLVDTVLSVHSRSMSATTAAFRSLVTRPRWVNFG